MMARVATNAQVREAVSSLTIPATMLGSIMHHLAATLPNEGVGLIAVAKEPETWRATAFIPGTNVDCSPTRYTMDPAEVVAGLRMIEANGWQLGAIVHSHVLTPPTPSRTDVREAYYPDALMLIVGFVNGQAEPRLWRLDAGDRPSKPVEILLVTEPHTRAATIGKRSAGLVVISQESQARDS
jgi:proteasome lid subunit RPN8/RPN11